MNAPVEPTKSRARGWAVAVVAMAFMAGALAGAGTAHLRMACHPGDEEARLHHLPPPLEAVGLSEEQERQVREVMDRYHPRIQETMRESWPRLKPVFDDMAKEIKVFLTEDQRAKFDEERKKMEERRFGSPDGRTP